MSLPREKIQSGLETIGSHVDSGAFGKRSMLFQQLQAHLEAQMQKPGGLSYADMREWLNAANWVLESELEIPYEERKNNTFYTAPEGYVPTKVRQPFTNGERFDLINTIFEHEAGGKNYQKRLKAWLCEDWHGLTDEEELWDAIADGFDGIFSPQEANAIIERAKQNPWMKTTEQAMNVTFSRDMYDLVHHLPTLLWIADETGTDRAAVAKMVETVAGNFGLGHGAVAYYEELAWVMMAAQKHGFTGDQIVEVLETLYDEVQEDGLSMNMLYVLTTGIESEFNSGQIIKMLHAFMDVQGSMAGYTYRNLQVFLAGFYGSAADRDAAASVFAEKTETRGGIAELPYVAEMVRWAGLLDIPVDDVIRFWGEIPVEDKKDRFRTLYSAMSAMSEFPDVLSEFRRNAADAIRRGDVQKLSSLSPDLDALEERDGAVRQNGITLEAVTERLSDYEYKGQTPVLVECADGFSGVVFLTVDMKISPDDSVKVLEINGVGSRMTPNPVSEGGEQAAVERIARVMDALAVPNYGLFVQTDADADAFIMASIASQMGIGGMYGSWLGEHATILRDHDWRVSTNIGLFARPENGPGQKHPTLDKRGYVWSYVDTLRGKKFLDFDRFGFINGPNITKLAQDKKQFRSYMRRQGAADMIPRSWVLPWEGEGDELDEQVVARAANSRIGRFILKPSVGNEGQSIVVLDNTAPGIMQERMRALFVDDFDDRRYSYGDRKHGLVPPEGWLRRTRGPFLLEEYIQSKPILSRRDADYYDATARVAFIGIADKGTMLVVPVCGYWKLPEKPMKEGWGETSRISGADEGEPMSEKDFKSAFSRTAALASILVKRAAP